MEPYEAWFFFAADDIDEVNREYAKCGFDGDGYRLYPKPDLAQKVRVVAVEAGTPDEVWFIRDGMLERRPSWTVRELTP